MSYLRADDSLDANPKILALGNDQRRYTWVRVLLYTIRFASPEIPPNINETVPKATRTFLGQCTDIGLVDVDTKSGTMRVHDWDEYNGIVAEQRERWKENKRTQRGQAKDNARTNQGQPEDETVDSRVGARSRVPFPSPLSTSSLSPSPGLEHPRATETDDGRITQRITETHELVDGGHGYLIPRQTSDLPPELEAIDPPAILAALEQEHHR